MRGIGGSPWSEGMNRWSWWGRGKLQELALHLTTLGEWRLAVQVLRLDVGNTLTDSRVRVLLKVTAGSNALGVRLQLLSSSGLVLQGDTNSGNLTALLSSEREPVSHLRLELLLVGHRDRGVEKRRGRGHLNAVGTNGVNSLLSEFDSSA